MPITHRYVGNPLFSFLTKVLYQIPFNDVYCGMKILKKEFFNKIHFFSTGMVFCLEILIKSKINKAKMGEIPITLFKDGRKIAKSHLKTISDGLKTLKFIMICSPKLLFFIPSGLFFLSTIILTILNFNFFIIEIKKVIFINFLLIFLSIQFFMLGIYSALRAKQIQIYKGDLLYKFFKLFKLRLAIVLGLAMMILPGLLNFLNIIYFEDIYNFIYSGLIALLGINIIANSFFVSLLEIDGSN